MTDGLSELQRLFMWRILADGGEAWLKHVKPVLEPAKRAPLVQAAFIETERRRDPETKGWGLYVRVLDAGWAWAGRNMDAALPARSTAGGQILQLLLTRLRRFLAVNNSDVATVLVPSPAQALGERDGLSSARQTTLPPCAADTSERIMSACERLAAGDASGRVRLADLRQELRDIVRSILDATLLQLSRDGKLVLYRLDNPAEIQAADREAVLITASGEPRHVVHLG